MSASIKEQIAKELLKCGIDKAYFMDTYCKIEHPIRGLIDFDLYPFQVDCIHALDSFDYNIILKSRQLGISTLVAGEALHTMIFQDNANILCIATKQETAKNMVKKVRTMWSNLPSWLKPKEVEDNKLSLRFTNGSTIKAVSAAGDSGRSEAVTLLIIDEGAFIDGIDDIWTSAQQTLATGGRCVVLSTPNGVGNWFHKTWVTAVEKLIPEEIGQAFNPIELPWQVHPDRDQRWRDAQDVLLGDLRKARQECDCDFLASGLTVVDADLIVDYYKKELQSKPIEERGPDGNIWVWKQPDYNKRYVVTADVSRGDGSDYSAFHIFDLDEVEQVAEYRGKIHPRDFGNLLVNVATEYNDALLVIETANVGFSTIQVALDRDYKNLYYTYKDDKYVDESVQLRENRETVDKSKKTPGFITSSRTRPLIIEKMVQYMNDKTPKIHSERLMNELMTFIWKNNRAQAQSGYNDDLTMAFAIAMWVRDTAIRLSTAGRELTKSALQSFSMSKPISSGASNRQARRDAGWELNMGHGTEDMTWLLNRKNKK